MRLSRACFAVVVCASCCVSFAASPDEWSQWKELSRIWVGQSHLTTADLSSDERLILVLSQFENSVRVYDRRHETLLLNFQIPQHDQFDPVDVTFWPKDPDEPKLLIGTEKGLFLYDALTGELAGMLGDQPSAHMRWSPKRDILVINERKIPAQKSVLNFYRIGAGDTLEKFKTMPFENRVDEWDLDNAGRVLVAVFYPSDTVARIDLETEKVVWEKPAPKFTSTVDLSPDGTRVAIGGEAFLLLDANKPERSHLYGDFGNNINSVRFAPSGDAVAVSSYDGHIRILSANLEDLKIQLLADLRHLGTANVYALIFYAGGKRLISTSGDRTIRFWGIPREVQSTEVKVQKEE